MTPCRNLYISSSLEKIEPQICLEFRTGSKSGISDFFKPSRFEPLGRAASGGALAPEPPRATRSQPEFFDSRQKRSFLSNLLGSNLKSARMATKLAMNRVGRAWEVIMWPNIPKKKIREKILKTKIEKVGPKNQNSGKNIENKN